MSNPFTNAEEVKAVIKIRRGPESDRTSNAYDTGELIYSTDTKRVYVGDNTTLGGNLVGNKAWVINNNNFSQLTNIVIGDTVYRTDNSSYYVLTGAAYTSESSYALVGGNNLITQSITNGTLPKATTNTLGGVIVGNGLSVANDGKISVSGGFTLTPATQSTLGGIKVGTGLSATTDGILSLSAIPSTAINGQILSWNGIQWVASNAPTGGGGGGGTSGLVGLIKNKFKGTGGTTYVLTNYTDNNSDNYIVFINGIQQVPDDAYTITTPNIIFTGNVPNNADILVYCSTNAATPVGGSNDTLPIGSVVYFAANTAPVGYMECDGRAVLRSTYPDLDAAIYCGNNNNSNNDITFGYRCTLSTKPYIRSLNGSYIVLPDLRGEFIRGWDHIASNGAAVNIDTGRTFGSKQDPTYINNRPQKNSLSSPNNNNGEIEMSFRNSDSQNTISVSTWQRSSDWYSLTQNSTEFSSRPHNVALLPCIKVTKTGNQTAINYIPKPTNVTNDGDVLTYQQSTNSWVASAASSNPFTAKAWVNFDGSKEVNDTPDTNNTDRFIRSSYNISRVNRTGKGDFDVYFAVPMTTSNYCVFASCGNGDSSRAVAMTSYLSPPATNKVQLTVVDQSFDGKDWAYINLMVFGM